MNVNGYPKNTSPSIKPSVLDTDHLRIIRDNVNAFIKNVARDYVSIKGARVLDIAPQDHVGAKPLFPSNVIVDTLDINPESNATIIANICACNDNIIKVGTYDYVVCTEVLEHTSMPFNAVDEIWRILKPQGYLFLSVPFNFRIHGPLPDCWRFTEHGIRAILRQFNIIELNATETAGRPLMPIHYTVVAQKVRKEICT